MKKYQLSATSTTGCSKRDPRFCNTLLLESRSPTEFKQGVDRENEPICDQSNPLAEWLFL